MSDSTPVLNVLVDFSVRCIAVYCVLGIYSWIANIMNG